MAVPITGANPRTQAGLPDVIQRAAAYYTGDDEDPGYVLLFLYLQILYIIIWTLLIMKKPAQEQEK